MKNVTLLFFCLLATSTILVGQDFPDMDKSPMDMAYYPQRAAFRNFADTEEEKMANQPVMRVTYSRPQKNDRNVFGELLEYGEMWRVGANETTEIMFLRNVRIGEQVVPAGRYGVFAMVNEGEWTVHFSTDLDGWGQYTYKPAETGVAMITVPTESTESTVEALSILFDEADDGAHMIIAWDDTMVRVPIQF